MTALVLPRFVLPDPWRLLRPLKLDGQWSPRQRLQYVDADPGVHSRGGLPPITGGYVASYSKALNDPVHTFTSCSIGTAASNRRVVVGITQQGRGSVSLSSMTIGGVSATLLTQYGGTSGFFNTSQFAHAVVPTGTTATVTATYSTDIFRSYISIWAIYGASATIYDDQGEALDTTSASCSATVAMASGGFGVCLAGKGNTTPTTFSWTNATERSDSTYGGNNSSASSADYTAAATITATQSSTTQKTLACATFKPG